MRAGWLGSSCPGSSALVATIRRDRQRSFVTTSRRPRDLLAKYAAPYDTISTQPVTASLQTVASPASVAGGDEDPASHPVAAEQTNKGKRLAVPLPVMMPVEQPQVAASTAAKKPEHGEMTVEGVHVPARPIPPGEEECCMSGCVNCVYNIYTDDVLHYNEALAHARSALEMSRIPRHKWPKQVAAIAHGHGHAGKGDVESVAASSAREQVDDLMDNMDPGLRAFLQLEGKLKTKKKRPRVGA